MIMVYKLVYNMLCYILQWMHKIPFHEHYKNNEAT